MRKTSGFTLIELMTVIGIMAIVATIAIPNFLRWLPNYRLGSAARGILSAMQHARMVAVKENVNVLVNFDLANNHFVIFPDYDSDDKQDAGERALVGGLLPAGITLDEVKFGADNAFSFNGRGLASGSGGTIRIANKRKTQARIRVNRTGNARILRPGDK